MLAVLKRLVRLLRRRWPKITIEVRGDAGFAVPRLYAYLETQGIAYTIALGSNPRLKAMAASQVEWDALLPYLEQNRQVLRGLGFTPGPSHDR